MIGLRLLKLSLVAKVFEIIRSSYNQEYHINKCSILEGRQYYDVSVKLI